MRYFTAIIFSISIASFAQQYNPALWANDTLMTNDQRLKEMPTKVATADEMLNNTIRWKNPYPTVTNNASQGFDFTKVGKKAPKGVYPRMFTSPDEFVSIQQRLNTTNIGKQLRLFAEKEYEKLENGVGYDGALYKKLLTGDTVQFKKKFKYSDFANQLAIHALLAQLDNNKKRYTEIGIVSGNFLMQWIKDVNLIPEVQGRDSMIKENIYMHASMAKLFDFAANAIPPSQKKVFTDFYTKETKGKCSDGMQLPPHWRRWNHISMSLSYPLSVLCVENEKGYDKRIYDRGLEVLQDYLTYTFSPEGMSNEGITYTFGPFVNDLLLMSAAAKRGNPSFWFNPHFRKIPDWLISALSPNPRALLSSHGDTGSASEVPWQMMMIMKYYFPTDQKIDYLLSNAMPDKLNKLPDVSAFVFATDASKTKEVYNGVPSVEMPLTYFSPQRGSFITRNKWNKDGIQFQLDARQDMLFQSHDHSDRGNIELASHGRLWIVDGWRSTESKYHSVITIDGRGQGYFATPASWLNYIDTKQATFGVINQKYCYDWMWLKSPVADLLLNKTVAPQWQKGVYADVAASLKKYYPNAVPQRDPLRKVAEYFTGNLATNPLIWNEDTWPMRLPNFEVAHAFRTAGLVKGKHDYVLVVDDIKKDNQERLYEWLLPMPLDVEVVSIKQLVDVKQESSSLNIGFNTLSNKGTQGEYDILLGDKSMKRDMQAVDEMVGETFQAGRFMPQKGDPQLLVRVLNRTEAPRPNLEPNPRLEVIEKLKTEDMHQFYYRSMGIGKRLVVPSRSNNPDFKVLLFPHLNGEEIPTTKWNQDRTVLLVTFKDQEDTFYFTKATDGRTKVKLVRAGLVVFDL